MPPVEKKIASLDYPSLAQNLIEASGEAAACKLPPGLYIVATPIGHLGDITLRALMTLAQAAHIACEDTRNSGSMLGKYGVKKPLIPYHDHNARESGEKILALIKGGEAVALISDAGMPLISDPGFGLVRSCRAHNIPVTVIPGASAAVTALASSGLPTDAFYFAGFLPPKTAARQKTIASLAPIPGTLLIYEAPQRLGGSLADLAKLLGPERPAAIARELTKLFEEVRRGTLAELRDYYGVHEVKGEIVIVIGPSSENRIIDIDSLLRDALKTMSLRDAVQSVSTITGEAKKTVYDLALKLSGKEKGRE